MKKILLFLLPWLAITVPMKAWIDDNISGQAAYATPTYVTIDGQEFGYRIINSTEHYVEIGIRESANTAKITIPSTFINNNVTYTVTRIANAGFTDYYYSKQTARVTISTTAGSCANSGDVKSDNSVFAGSGTNGEPTSYSTRTIDGVTYYQSYGTSTSSSGVPYSDGYQRATSGNYYLNPTLEEIELPNTITEIGACAFAGCTALKSFTLPGSVNKIRPQAFACCTSMTEFKFNTNAHGETDVKVIPIYCFIGCTALTQLVFPEGIEVIQNRALQYCFNLESIHLPNTLVLLGTHFLCEAHALTTITIPAGVKYISYSLFHACCALREVYLLGEPSYLDDTDGGHGGNFTANDKFGGGAVNNCKVYVYEQYLTSYNQCEGEEEGGTYEQALSEGIVQEGEEYSNATGWSSLTTVSNTNCYIPIKEVTRTVPAKWVTMKTYKAMTKEQAIKTFGEGVKVAFMTSAKWNKEKSYTVNDYYNMYDITFTVTDLSEKNDDDIVIHANTPYMLRPSKESTYVVYNATVMKQDGGYETGDDGTTEETSINGMTHSAKGNANDISDKHVNVVKVDMSAYEGGTPFEAVIAMGGYYTTNKLQKWEHYFKNPKHYTTNGTLNDDDGNGNYEYDYTGSGYMGFYRCKTAGSASVSNGSCFWHIDEFPNGQNSNVKEKENYGIVESAMLYDFEEVQNEATGVEEVHVKLATGNPENTESIYSITGQKISKDNLKKGVYIMDGKKIYIK